MMKKLNAVLGLAAFLVNTVHCFLTSLSMIVPLPFTVPVFFPRGLAAIVLAHILLSVLTLFACTDTRGAVSYPKKNYDLTIQRIAGFLSLIFLTLHVLQNTLHVFSSFTVILVIEVLFILLIEVHIAVSVPRGLLSLGTVRTQKGCIGAMIFSYAISFLLTAFAFAVFAIEIFGA